MRTTRIKHAFAATGVVLTLSLTAACGGESTSDTSSSATAEASHNDADVTFAQDMLVHHAQAIEMVELTNGRPLAPQVEQLASEIKDAQAPEIKTFTGWLEAWGEDVPDGSMSSMEGMDMPGMMTSSDMQQLETASDEAFQTRWLEMMVEHHEGAIEMAKTQVADGKYQPAVDLAKQIESSQSAEVETMKQLLAS